VEADKTIPNNNLHRVVSDNEKGTCLFIDITISAYRNVIKSEAEKIFKYVELKKKAIQVIIRTAETTSKSFRTPEQHTWNAQHQGTTEESHIGHCIRTSKSAA
jgi:hypothetical protein